MTISLSSEPRLVAWLTEKSHRNEITHAYGRREWVVLIYEWKRREVKFLGLHIMAHATTVRSTTPRPRLRKGARVLPSTPREWRAGTTASRAKGGRPGTTAVVPRRHLLASHIFPLCEYTVEYWIFSRIILRERILRIIISISNFYFF